MSEDQDRDWIDDIKGQLAKKQRNKIFRDEKILQDRGVLGRALDKFWSDFRKVTGEMCERLSKEIGVSIACKWNGEHLTVSRSNSRYNFVATVGTAPPYEINILGREGLLFTASVRIVLDETELDWLAMMDGSHVSAREVAGKALKALVMA